MPAVEYIVCPSVVAILIENCWGDEDIVAAVVKSVARANNPDINDDILCKVKSNWTEDKNNYAIDFSIHGQDANQGLAEWLIAFVEDINKKLDASNTFSIGSVNIEVYCYRSVDFTVRQ